MEHISKYMKKIVLTLEVNGEKVSREYRLDSVEQGDWNEIVADMADTISKSKEPMK